MTVASWSSGRWSQTNWRRGRAQWSAAIDLYELTADRKHLDKAQSLASDTLRKFLYRGLFVSSMQLHPEGDKSVRTRVYDDARARVAGAQPDPAAAAH